MGCYDVHEEWVTERAKNYMICYYSQQYYIFTQLVIKIKQKEGS